MSTVLRLLNQTVTIETEAGRDEYDEPGFNTGVTYKARVQGGTTLFRRPDDEESIAAREVWIEPGASVATGSQITLPDGVIKEVIYVESMPDRNGSEFYVKVMTGA